MKLPFINKGIFESLKSPIERYKSLIYSTDTFIPCSLKNTMVNIMKCTL